MAKEPNINRSLRVVTVLFVAFSLVMGLLVYGIWRDGEERDEAVESVEEALAQFEADRIDRSVNACQDRNAIRIGMNRLALTAAGHDQDGFPTDVFTSASPERQETARLFLSNLIALQVCTTEAIDLYVSSNRTQGLVVIDGSDGDYREAVTPP